MVIGAPLAERSVSRTAYLADVSRTIVSWVMVANTNLGKVSYAKHNSEQKLKLKDSDRRVLKIIIVQKCKTTLLQVTSEMSIHHLNPVYMKPIQRELHATNINGRVAIPKPLTSLRNALKRLQWCRNPLNWTQLQ
ncbi:transposable element Tc1 transposase [Trichonephila clavipes]|nr:transposable element Tc1 transposase [Trichonephila clavipes]